MLSKNLFRRNDIVTIISNGRDDKQYASMTGPRPFYYMNDDMLELCGLTTCIESVDTDTDPELDHYHVRMRGISWAWTDAMFVEGRRIMRHIVTPPYDIRPF